MTIIVLFVIQRLIKLFNHKVKLLAFVIVTKTFGGLDKVPLHKKLCMLHIYERVDYGKW